MTTPAPAPSGASLLLTTIEADLQAGISWLEGEALTAGLAVWNTLKAAFIALEPAEGQILMNLLSGVVADAAGGKSLENMATDALNTASSQELTVLTKAGTGVVTTLLAGLNSKFNMPASSAAALQAAVAPATPAPTP